MTSMSNTTQPIITHLFVGSTNPVKINAVINAASETWPEIIAQGFAAPSGVSDQPIGDEETRLGAKNRAVAALEMGLAGLSGPPSPLGSQDSSDSSNPTGFTSSSEAPLQTCLGVGLEGGVVELSDGLYSTVWVSVIDSQGNHTEANGARFRVPDQIAQLILAGGEMGPVVEKLVGEVDVRQKQGMIGVITNGFVDRTEEYTGIAKMALGLWYGRNWNKN
jgi:inosine/xanthosine triphosphatase